MECQYVATQRGGVALVFEGHRYNKVRDGKDGTVYWRCSRDRQCPGRAVTVNNRVKKANNKHNHPPEAMLRNGTNNSASAAAGSGYSASVGPMGSSNVSAQHDSSASMRLPSSIAIQEVLEAQNAAAAAAASLPAIVTETLKYLAVASGNQQMAAFASSMASLSSPALESFERSMGRAGLLPGAIEYLSDSSDEQPLNMALKNTGQLVKKLRDLMKSATHVSEAIQAYIIPSVDAHQSEYIAECDNRLRFISGFTGSCGTAVITLDEAALWTDGRYFLQAEKQLDQNWLLMREGIPGTPTQGEWLCKVLSSGSRVGVDPMIIPFNQWQSLSSQLENCGNSLVPVAQNLVDLLWEERPPLPANAVFPLPASFAGQTWQEKVVEVRKEMNKKQASALVLTALDEIAWLLNLRGSDIDYNPVFFAYCVVTLDNLYLFVDEGKLIPETLKHLHLDASPIHENSGLLIEQRPYKLILDFLKWSVSQQQGKIWISNQSSYSLVSLIPQSKRITDPNPVLIKKTIKNSVEIECMRRAHLKDAVALCEFFAWLEEEITKSEITELSAAAKLEEFRKTQEEYVGPSFPTISASGPNAAVIHYRPTEKANRRLTPNEIYLCDTGTQYRDGTTDITRTVHLGTPSDYEKECYTRVVKGHINLASAIFPNLTKGQMLDSFARKPLWDVGLDYRHGTGHGVGMFLNVHEGPVGISLRYRSDDPGLQPGMILSNEPGFYEDGQFGIRIENLVLVTKADTKYNFGNKDYLKFETITLVPIQTKLLDPSLLTEEEIEWLDSYHQTCREVVGKALKEQGRTNGYQWLMKETQPLG